MHMHLGMSVQVCNHPDLFEGRPIVSSFDMWGIDFHLPSLALHALVPSKWGALNLGAINADLLAQEHDGAWAAQTRQVPATTAMHSRVNAAEPVHL